LLIGSLMRAKNDATGASSMRVLILLIASFISFAAPACAADDIAAAQTIIRSQEQALGHDDAVFPCRAGYTRHIPGR
jgi:hypothetical protein